MPGAPRRGANPAVRGEPRGIGSAGARDPLAREVRLLGALLGQVIAEQGGPQLLALVEETRRDLVALRKGADLATARRVAERLDDLDVEDWERLAHAFALHFQLVNLAEEKQRLRQLRRRERAGPFDAAARERRRRGRDAQPKRSCRDRWPPRLAPAQPGPDGPPHQLTG